MTTYKTVLIDDEQKSTDILHYLIQRHCPELRVESIFNDPSKAIDYIKDNPLDLLFLDIQMPQLDGFQLLDSLLAIDFRVVFVTAHDEFALKAFRYYALDYLLKPVDAKELKGLVARLRTHQQIAYNKQDYYSIMNEMNLSSKAHHSQLAVPTSKGVEFIKLKEVIRLQADSNYTHIICKQGRKIYAAKTLKHFEGILPAAEFFRPHQSHLINTQHIIRFHRSDGGIIIMEDGKEITLSRSKRHEFLERFVR